MPVSGLWDNWCQNQVWHRSNTLEVMWFGKHTCSRFPGRFCYKPLVLQTGRWNKWGPTMKSSLALLRGNGSTKREPGAFIAVLLVLLAAWLLGQMLEEVNDSSVIFLSSNSCHSVLGTVVAILSGTCDVQFPLCKSVACLNLSANVVD